MRGALEGVGSFSVTEIPPHLSRTDGARQRSGCLETGCEHNLAAHNPHFQETCLQNTAEAESKVASILGQVMCGRLPSSVQPGPEGN